MRLKYEEKRVRDLGIGSDGLTLIHKENQILRKFLSSQDVGGFKSISLAIHLRLKHAPDADWWKIHSSVRIIAFLIRPSEASTFCLLKNIFLDSG
jgi:hypothetical protein